jgi:hypothetical protein
MMRPEDVIAAFGLPASAIRPTRIHKTVLNERGAATAADRKLIDAVVDRLDWMATLSPATIGVAAGDSVTAIQLLSLSVRAQPTQRLLTVIHRAIPLPVVLITAFEQSVHISLAPLRAADRIEGAVVVERLIVSPEIEAFDSSANAFLGSLAVATQPRTSLDRLYEGLIWRTEAFAAARISGGAFRVAENAESAHLRGLALAEHQNTSAEFAKARAAARAEKSLSKQVKLADSAQFVKTRLDKIAKKLI